MFEEKPTNNLRWYQGKENELPVLQQQWYIPPPSDSGFVQDSSGNLYIGGSMVHGTWEWREIEFVKHQGK